MHYSLLRPGAVSRETVSVFGGYNHRPRIGAGEFYHMENLSDRLYPLLSPRPQRGFYTGGSDIRALLAKEQLCYVDGESLVVGQERYNLGLVSKKPQLISMGAYVVIMPDKKYLNTADPADRGSLEAFYEGGPYTAALCRADGSPLEIETWEQEPQEGSLRVRNSQLLCYSAGSWVTVPGTHLKISAPGLGQAFREGDGVELEGDERLPSHGVIRAKGADYIVIEGFLEKTVQGENLCVSRRVPELDFCVEAGNRLWGCRYGRDRSGNTVNALYSSKLGDFKNWQVFQGISTDSYSVSLGSDGPFTGAVNYLGQPLFFKEQQIIRVWGTEPSSFSVQAEGCRGVRQGSSQSLAVVGETLLYQSRTGICAYNGGLPVEVSQELGDEVYRDAVAGGYGNKYYVSMADSAGQWHLFVYNTLRKLWHREDGTKAAAFADFGGDLYFLDAADGQIKTVCGLSGAKYSEPISWVAETGLMGLEEPGKKRLQNLKLRLTLWPESQAAVYVEYDSSGSWEFACALKGVGTRVYSMPVKPRPCDHFRLRLEGRGEMRLMGIILERCS